MINITDIINYNFIIENDSEIDLYKKLSLKVIKCLEENVKCDFNQIVKYVGGSDRRMLRLLDQMVNKELIRFDDGLFNMNNNSTISALSFECKACKGNSVNTSVFNENYTTLLELAYKQKPLPTFVFDQRPVNFKTILDRVAYFTYRGDIHNKKIAIVGDDDLTSIGLALLKISKQIVVYDIDTMLLEFINKFSGEHNLDIECHEIDLFQKNYGKIDSDFDVFITDPTPEPNPFLLFMNFCTQLLDTNGVGYISFYSTAMNQNIEIQKILTDMNYLITDLNPLFTSYAFIKETYSENDFKLLEKYSKNKISVASFYETLCRVEKTNETKIIEKNVEIKDILGKATKRIINNPKLDPRYLENKEFVINTVKKLK